MSHFPINTPQGLYQAVNYLASGPSGLGQNFQGFSDYNPAYLTGNFRLPFTVVTTSKYASGISGTSFITVTPNLNNIVNGQYVTGDSIPANTTVLSSTTSNTSVYTVNLSSNLTASISSETVTFTPKNIAKLYVAPIACSSAVQIDDYTFQYNFATVQSSPPFSQGNPITGSDFANDFYNGGWAPIGVASCSTSNVVVKTSGANPGIGNTTTGNVSYDSTGTLLSTDCNARVVVQGGTDRVFISAQLTDTISYIGSGNLTYTVDVNRYIGTLNNDPTNPDYLFNFDQTISQKVYTYNGLTGPGTLNEIETIFSTVIDQPAPNYYWYILEVQFDVTGNLQIPEATLGLRSLSAQVVKQ